MSCIGCALEILITWGLQGIIAICIIVATLFLILIINIFALKLSTKRLMKKFNHLKNTYPYAYSYFLKEVRIFKPENSFTRQDIKRITSFPEIKWKEIQELKQLQRDEQVLAEYNMIKTTYSNGLACWEKEHPSASKLLVINNITEIINFDKRQKKFLVTEKWEQAQVAFSKLCRSKKSTTPHSGCYFYNLNLVKTNYKGETLKGNYRVWQFFFSSFCTATDLNYTYFKRILENNNNIEKYKQGKIKFPSYLNIEISNFIKSLNVPVQVITFGTNPDESLQFQFLTSNLAVLGIQSSNFHHLDKLSSNYVAIIDEITTQTQFVERCKSVMQQFEHQNPCIIYISFMKEFSRKEMQELINKKDKELWQQKYE